jgi:CheY-like chemotaxis protein
MSKPLSIIADDHPTVRSFLRLVLQSGGFDVREAENGLQALELVRRLGPSVSVVVSDVLMPEMDGITLAHSLRQEFPGMPVVLVSGFTHEAVPPNMPFLRKPFQPKVLLAEIEAAMSERRDAVTACGQ